jgi:hypothetical protein
VKSVLVYHVQALYRLSAKSQAECNVPVFVEKTSPVDPGWLILVPGPASRLLKKPQSDRKVVW